MKVFDKLRNRQVLSPTKVNYSTRSHRSGQLEQPQLLFRLSNYAVGGSTNVNIYVIVELEVKGTRNGCKWNALQVRTEQSHAQHVCFFRERGLGEKQRERERKKPERRRGGAARSIKSSSGVDCRSSFRLLAHNYCPALFAKNEIGNVR